MGRKVDTGPEQAGISDATDGEGDAEALEVKTCTDNGEDADFWLKPESGMSDKQMGGLLLLSLARGLASAMKGRRQGGTTCDISERSLLALIGKARGVAVGPVVYMPNCCQAPRASSQSSPDEVGGSWPSSLRETADDERTSDEE